MTRNKELWSIKNLITGCPVMLKSPPTAAAITSYPPRSL